MSVLPRLAAVAADSSVAFDNLLFGNKHNMTSFRCLVITVIKNVRACVCVCVSKRSVRSHKSVCGGEEEKEGAELRSDNVCQRLARETKSGSHRCTGSSRPYGGVTATDIQANEQMTINWS